MCATIRETLIKDLQLYNYCCQLIPHTILTFKVCEQAYDPPAGYNIPYLRPAVDETVRGRSLPSPQEVCLSY